MNISDHIELSFSNLWKRKLRTSLTTAGVTVGIGALVSMVSFGLGMQKNITDSFNSLELFNSITVFPDSLGRRPSDPDEPRPVQPQKPAGKLLDEQAAAVIAKLPGVETVFPDIRFPALVKFNGAEDFKLIQVVPAKIASSKMIRIIAGKPYRSDDIDEVIVSSRLLRQFKVADPAAVGKKIELSSVALNPSALDLTNWAALLQGGGIQFESYSFVISGVSGDAVGPGGPVLNDLYMPSGAASKVNKLPFNNIWDLFRVREGKVGYSALNVRLASPRYVDPVKAAVRGMGFSCLAFADQLGEIKTTFYYLDMVLAAVGMIAIVVASLGIINTMVMSILERYSEIGIMKAVGASDRDVQKIFFFESCSIGFLGGLFGLVLGWSVSRVINRIMNFFLARQGVPYLDYFNLTLWLCLAAIGFSVLVSLIAGIYPAARAARIDPVVALRHE